MSEFGDGTFEQALMDWIRMEADNHQKSKIETVKALSYIAAYIAEEVVDEAALPSPAEPG